MAAKTIQSVYLQVTLLLVLTTGTVIKGQVYTGDLRLINSTGSINLQSGRMEIYDNGEWNTVCINGFDGEDATLACNQLGYQSYQNYGTVGQLGFPSASFFTTIWAANIACDTSNPSHLTLYQCPRGSSVACNHNQDVALECVEPYNISNSRVWMSSSRGSSVYLTAGLVNIFYAGRSGTICNKGFTDSDARALCHIITGSSTVLTYGSVGSANLEFTQASTDRPVWIENLQCRYISSTSRYTCTHNGLGITSCTHRNDVALSCLAEGATRLVSQRSITSNTDPGSNAGRLEIYYNGRWGTVCSDMFDSIDADVVCSQLGYRRADRFGTVGELGYPQGTGDIWLDDVQCNSTDLFLANCTHRGFGVHNCDHSEDVAISCSQAEHNDGTLRFINETYIFSSMGRLEIYLNGHWGTICSNGFGPEDATLACNQLGYRTYQRYGTVGQLGYSPGISSTPILVSNLACDTSNTDHLTLYQCPRSDGSSCTHSQDVALICSSPYGLGLSSLRFAIGNNKTSNSLTAGRVEIFFAGRWGSICSDGLTQQDAMGICHILTRSADVLAYGAVGSTNLGFAQGPASSPVWVEDFHCMYHAIDRRYYCDWDGLGITSCSHSQDLALSCQADGAVRLVSDQSVSATDPGGSAGRLEVFYSGVWGTVCETGFSETAADIVCRQLGYDSATSFGNVGELGYSQGTGTIWLTNVQCNPDDLLLTNCSHSGFSVVRSCSHSQDVAVKCVQTSGVSSLSVGAIAGISIVIIAATIVACITAITVIVCCRHKSKNRQQAQLSRTPPSQAASNFESTPPEKPQPEHQAASLPMKDFEKSTSVSANAPPPFYAPPQPQYPYPYPGQPQDMPQYPQYPEYPQYPAQYQPPPYDPHQQFPVSHGMEQPVADQDNFYPAVGGTGYYPRQ